MRRANWVKLVGFLVVAVLVATALGTTPSRVALAEEHEPVTIKLLNWDQGGTKYWDAAVAAFMAQYPWITVEREAVTFERYYEFQGAYISSKSGPDVMANNVGLELYERKDAYLPINDRIGPYVADLISYRGGCLDFDPNKDCYGLPQSFQGNVMYYNRDILKAAGLDPDNPPQTWEDFGAACEKIKAIGKDCIAMGTGTTIAYWNFPEIAKNYWESEDDMLKFFRGEIPWTDPKMRSILEKMAEMAEKGWFQEEAPTTVFIPDGGNYFRAEKAAFAASIISDVENWLVNGEAIGHEKLGVMLWPAINPDAPLARKFSSVEGFVHGVTAWSKHPDEAFMLVAWLAGPENANLFLTQAGGQPINKKFDKSLVNYSPSFTKIQDIILNPTLHAGIMGSGREMDALSRGYQQIMLGEITVDDWVKMMQTALEESPTKKPKQ
jgi:raffinose/stachyose/melibiose transport system substrate-binding protein